MGAENNTITSEREVKGGTVTTSNTRRRSGLSYSSTSAHTPKFDYFEGSSNQKVPTFLEPVIGLIGRLLARRELASAKRRRR